MSDLGFARGGGVDLWGSRRQGNTLKGPAGELSRKSAAVFERSLSKSVR